MPQDREPVMVFWVADEYEGVLHPEVVLFWLWLAGVIPARASARACLDEIEREGFGEALYPTLDSFGFDVYEGLEGLFIYQR